MLNVRCSLFQFALAVSATSCDRPRCVTNDAGALFGRPVAQTGLSAELCNQSCTSCESSFQSSEFTATRLENLLTWNNTDQASEITENPYLQPAHQNPGVCGMVVDDLNVKTYHMKTFESVAELKAQAGAVLTHHDGCGACSSLQDFTVYAREIDLGKPVSQCGVDTFTKGFDANVTCLLKLGFTKPCAQIWAWNTFHTREKCLDKCFLALDEPYHSANGKLNACLQCDEVQSGPVFKAVAGRTRRNTGIASAICRPCSEVQAVVHEYP